MTQRVQVVVAHEERVTLRVGRTFIKIDSDPARIEREVEAMTLAPIPTATVLWQHAGVVALAELPGTPLGRLGEPSAAPAGWTVAGAAIRTLHEATPPEWPGQDLSARTARLDDECGWLLDQNVLPADLVRHNRQLAETALRPWAPVFAHGDLQVSHVFINKDRVAGVLDWSEAGPGDALYDLATLTLGHPDRLPDLLAGYGVEVDLEVIRGWWSWRSLVAARWLIEHGFDPDSPGAEFDVLRAQLIE